MANHSALAPAVAKLSPEERKRGSEFALRLLPTLENTEADMPDEEEPPATARRSTRRK